MPDYLVTTPGGRKFKMSGEKPPSEADLLAADKALKGVPSIGPPKTAQSGPPVMRPATTGQRIKDWWEGVTEAVSENPVAKVFGAINRPLEIADEWSRKRIESGLGGRKILGSADPVLGAVNPEGGGMPEGFYSRVDRIAEGLPKSAHPNKIASLMKSGASQEELGYRQVGEFLRAQGEKPVSREAVLAHLKEHPAPQVTTKKLGGPKQRRLTDPSYTIHENPHAPGTWMFKDSSGEVRGGSNTRETVEQNAQAWSDEVRSGRLFDDIEGYQDNKFDHYQVPGGSDYRETLLTLPPEKTLGFKVEQNTQFGVPEQWSVDFADRGRPGQGVTGYVTQDPDPRKDLTWHASFQGRKQVFATKDGGIAWVKQQMQKIEGNIAQNDSGFRQSHWDEPNVVAHSRSNERHLPDTPTTPEQQAKYQGLIESNELGKAAEFLSQKGPKGRFIEEVQSDWHQKGKSHGYKTPESTQAVTAAQEEFARSAQAYRDADPALKEQAKEAMEEARAKLLDTTQQDKAAMPDAPFKETWPDLVLKQQLLDVADRPDLSWIGFTEGKTQAQRYDLSKQVREVYAKPIGDGRFELTATDHQGQVFYDTARTGPLTASQVADTVGKEMADKISHLEGAHTFSGLDLQVGGEGMGHFYDQLLPKRLEKILKPFGGTVEKGEIAALSNELAPSPEAHKILSSVDRLGFDSDREALSAIRTHPDWAKRWEVDEDLTPAQVKTLESAAKGSASVQAWIARLTPEMKAKIKASGLPLMTVALMATGSSPDRVRAIQRWLSDQKGDSQ